MKQILLIVGTFLSFSAFAGQGTIMKVPVSETAVLKDQTVLLKVKNQDFEQLRNAEVAEIGDNEPIEILDATDELIHGIQTDGIKVFVFPEEKKESF